MPAKKRKPRRRQRRSGSVAADIFRDRLRDVIRDHCGGVNAEFARRLKVDASRITEWLSGDALPGFQMLRRIGGEFHLSIDWLAGFDVPPERDKRAPIGALIDAFRDYCLGGFDPEVKEACELATAFRTAPVLADEGDALLRKAAFACLSAEFDSRAALMAQRVETLAAALRRGSLDGRYAPAARLMQHEAQNLSIEARALSADPASFFDSRVLHRYGDEAYSARWSALILEEAGDELFVSVGDVVPRAFVEHATPFRVPYGRGFVHRDSEDHIWFIDPQSGDPMFARGRFLQPPSDRGSDLETRIRSLPLVRPDLLDARRISLVYRTLGLLLHASGLAARPGSESIEPPSAARVACPMCSP